MISTENSKIKCQTIILYKFIGRQIRMVAVDFGRTLRSSFALV